jgi:hypothetical protein
LKFNDVCVYKEKRFSIGIEEQSGKYYLSIPVSNSFVDYEEYYEINKDEFDLYKDNVDAAAEFVRQCRNRECDDQMMMKPGKDRGVAI